MPVFIAAQAPRAIQTVSWRISARTPGRPTPRRIVVHFRAINWRCHRRIVSGVTKVAT